ncbi:retrovirus-related pol polyprotein from transposon TNT 1-94 [Tanacetum coccineum]
MKLRAKRMAKNANPLALVATAQTMQDPYYQTPKHHKSYAPTSKASLPTRSHAATRYKGKEIAKPITPPSESASEEDSDPEQAQKDKDMQKNLALIAKYKTDNQTGQFGNQRAVNVVGARETVGGPVVQQSGIQKGVQLQAEQSDWLADTDEEIDEQELEAHYSYMAKIQEVPNADSGTDAEPLEQVHYDTDHNVFANDLQHFEQSESIRNTCAVETGDSNVIPDSPDMCDNDIQNDQNDVECDNERAALANLIANLKLDVDDNKKIQKQLKKANATLTQELTECKSILAETSRTLGESNSIRDSCLVALQNKQTEFERYKAFNDRTVDYDQLEPYARAMHHCVLILLRKTWVPFIWHDQFAPTLGYGDLVQGNITIKRVYYVEGLNHNLFSVGQFCDADLEVAFRKSTCFVRVFRETTFLSRITNSRLVMASKTFSLYNFDYINLLSKKDIVIGLPKLKYVKDQLCSSCELSKAKRSSFKSKTVSSSKGRLNLLHMDSINGEKYILVIVDDYSPYTWTLFLRSKDETPEVLKDFLTMIQRNLQAPVISVRTDRGTEFLNKTLNAFFKEEGIEHQTSTPRTPEQNGVVERRNRTLVEAARTMLSASKLPLFFWAEAIATACYTQNRSIIIPTHEKTAYHIINDRKPSIKHLHIFGCTFKGISCLQQENKVVSDYIHLKFDEIKEMSKTSVANDTSGLVPQRQTASDYDNPDPAPELQSVYPSADTANHNSYNAPAEENNVAQAEFTNLFCTPVQEIAGLSSRNSGCRLEDVRIFVAYAHTSLFNLSGCERETVISYGPLKESSRAWMLNSQIHDLQRVLLKGSGFDLTAFSDADHAGCLDTRKSTSGGIQFLGDNLVSWMSKKQNCTAMSSAEAEYVALSASCAQVMWMRTQLQDYGFNYNKISCYCVSQFSLSALSCNPCAALPYQAYPYSFTKALPDERFSISSEGIGMEMFDSSRLEGRMPTKIELTLEQSQQGVSNDVLDLLERAEAEKT